MHLLTELLIRLLHVFLLWVESESDSLVVLGGPFMLVRTFGEIGPHLLILRQLLILVLRLSVRSQVALVHNRVQIFIASCSHDFLHGQAV